ncbi:hypothetical protein ACB092_08G087100 [Castanea dentata]
MFIHSPETLSNLKKPNSQTCTKKNIPLIDLSHFNSPTKRHQLVEQIRDATATWGFFQVINHGIPKSVLDETIKVAEALLELLSEGLGVEAERFKNLGFFEVRESLR